MKEGRRNDATTRKEMISSVEQRRREGRNSRGIRGGREMVYKAGSLARRDAYWILGGEREQILAEEGIWIVD